MMSTGPLGGGVTLVFYLLSQPTAEEATMLWLSCTLSSPGEKENTPLRSPDTLIYVVKNDKAQTCRPVQAEDWSEGGNCWKANKRCGTLNLVWHSIQHSKIKLHKIGTSWEYDKSLFTFNQSISFLDWAIQKTYNTCRSFKNSVMPMFSHRWLIGKELGRGFDNGIVMELWHSFSRQFW